MSGAFSTLLKRIWPAGSGRANGSEIRARTLVRLKSLSLDRGPVYAIGDVHGCAKLYKLLEAAIRQDAAAFGLRPQLVLLGDVIDRGPATAHLLDHLTRTLDWGDRWTLMGNHEAMMQAFIAKPQANRKWLNHGGFETLASYGLALGKAEMDSLADRRIQQMIESHLPHEHLDWLANLPHLALIEDSQYVLAHGGFDPGQDPGDQDVGTLLWGNALPQDRNGPILLRGHVVQTKAPDLEGPVINLDSGAYQTGTLTCLRLSNSGPPLVLSVAGKPG